LVLGGLGFLVSIAYPCGKLANDIGRIAQRLDRLDQIELEEQQAHEVISDVTADILVPQSTLPSSSADSTNQELIE
jgi:hypothetical protein